MLKLNNDPLFSTTDERLDEKKERVNTIDIKDLHDFPNHPFSVRDDENMEELVQSIKDNGLLHPILVRERVVKAENGESITDGYEIIAGHRRRHACIKAGFTEIPALVKNLKDDEATIFMVESNIQRDDVPPSERAFAYKLRAEAQKNLSFISNTAEPDENDKAMSATVWRYLRLTELVPDLLTLADNKRLPLIQGVCLSYVEAPMQQYIADCMTQNDASLSRKQADAIKALAMSGKLTEEKAEKIILGKKVKTTEKKRPPITFKQKDLEGYLPRDMAGDELKTYIIEALAYYAKHNSEDAQ